MTRRVSCKTIVTVLMLAFFFVAPQAFAQKGQIYTVKKGDTLWDLSKRFIEDPYYWPNIWSDNPGISNPHLIFPGQQIRILDGRLEIIPAYGQTEQTAIEDADPIAPTAPPSDELLSLAVAARGNGFILVNEEPQGRLLDATDNRMLLTETDLVFVAAEPGLGMTAGDTFGLYQRAETVVHPIDKRKLGTMMQNLGSLEVVEVRDNTLVARIDKAYREITRGAELFHYNPPQRDIALRRGTTRTPGVIVAAQDEKGTISTSDVIFIDLGRQDGVEVGNLFYISRQRRMTDEALKGARNLNFPEQVLGAAIVTETREATATAIIIKSVDTAAVGDRVTIVTD